MWRRNISVALTAVAISTIGGLALAAPSEASRGGQKVEIQDDCQPATFNLAVRPGACIGDGETSFLRFIAEVGKTQKAKEWRFDPSMLTVRAGRPVILKNEGGETHTFTMVKAFGGGFVPVLNGLSGNTVLAEECVSRAADGSLIPQPGGTNLPKPPSAVNVFVAADKEVAFKTAGLKPGKYMFQCCIHPWMRIVLTVK
jgi:plastocyanin